jgi:hypothetical protein
MLPKNAWRRKRVTQRAAARLVARVIAGRRTLPATTGDVSRTGVRVRLRSMDVGVEREAGLFDVGKALSAVLGDSFEIEFVGPKGAKPVRKSLTAVRIGAVLRTLGEIDVGCRFREPLTDEEAFVLGIRLPGAAGWTG